MKTSLGHSHHHPGRAATLLSLCCLVSGAAAADPAADAAAAASPPAGDLAPKGSFMSSLKQAFSQDFEKEVVRGHFDVGAAPDTHRYYCLVDPKSGKSEANGVAGTPVTRHDQMTGIKGASVSFFNCADAERKGMLVTSGYVLTSAVSAKIKPAAPAAVPRSAASAAAAASAPVAATAAVAAPLAAATAATTATAAPAAVSAPGQAQAEVTAVYTRFIAGQNAHDRAMVSQTLLDSGDFVWAPSGGNSVWGYAAALDAFEQSWKGTWKMDPQGEDLRIATAAADVAVLTTPVLFSEGPAGKAAPATPIRWAGVFVKTRAGWRIASIFITPFPGWRAPGH